MVCSSQKLYMTYIAKDSELDALQCSDDCKVIQYDNVSEVYIRDRINYGRGGWTNESMKYIISHCIDSVDDVWSDGVNKKTSIAILLENAEKHKTYFLDDNCGNIIFVDSGTLSGKKYKFDDKEMSNSAADKEEARDPQWLHGQRLEIDTSDDSHTSDDSYILDEISKIKAMYDEFKENHTRGEDRTAIINNLKSQLKKCNEIKKAIDKKPDENLLKLNTEMTNAIKDLQKEVEKGNVKLSESEKKYSILKGEPEIRNQKVEEEKKKLEEEKKKLEEEKKELEEEKKKLEEEKKKLRKELKESNSLREKDVAACGENLTKCMKTVDDLNLKIKTTSASISTLEIDSNELQKLKGDFESLKKNSNNKDVDMGELETKLLKLDREVKKYKTQEKGYIEKIQNNEKLLEANKKILSTIDEDRGEEIEKLKVELTNCGNSIKAIKKSKDDMEVKLKLLDNTSLENARLTEEVKEISEKCYQDKQRLSEEINKLISDDGDSEGKIQQLELENEYLQVDLLARMAEISTYRLNQDKYKDMDNMYKACMSQNTKKSDEYEKLLEQLKNDKENINKKYKDCEKRITELDRESKRLQDRFVDERLQDRAVWEKEVKIKEKEIEELRKDMEVVVVLGDRSSGVVGDGDDDFLIKMNKIFDKIDSNNDTLISDVEECDESRKETERKIKDCEKVVSDLNEKIEDLNDTHFVEIVELKTEKDIIEKALKIVETDGNSCLEKIREIDDEITDLISIMNINKEEGNVSSDPMINKLRIAIETYKSNDEQLKKTGKKLELSEKEIDELKINYDRIAQINKKLELDNSDNMKRYSTDLRGVEEKLKKECNDKTTKYMLESQKTCTKEIEDIRSSHKKELDALTIRIDESSDKLREYTKSKDEQIRDLTKLRKENEKRIDSLTKGLLNANDRIDLLSKQSRIVDPNTCNVKRENLTEAIVILNKLRLQIDPDLREDIEEAKKLIAV